MYKVLISSNSTHTREYEVDESLSPLEIANEYGRCEGGEKIEIYKDDEQVGLVLWTPENGGEYYEGYFEN